MFGALGHITVRQWSKHRLRLALTTIGIALGVGVFFAIRTANASLVNSLRVTVEKIAGKATLQVSAGESGVPEATLKTVRATPGVRVAEPVIEVMAQTSFAEQGSLLVLGVDTAGDQQLRDYQFVRSQTEVSDPLVFLAQPQSILLSRAFAGKHNLKIGDTLWLSASSGRKEFTVRGLFQPAGIGEVYGGNVAVMDVYSAQVVFDRGENFDRIDLMNEPNVEVSVLQQRLAQKLPAGLEVARPRTRGEAVENTVAAMRMGMQITSFVALLVGIFIIFNSFNISVNQRWKEIGILRAAGVERRRIQWMFMGEAALMGIAGSAIGIAGGYYAALLISKIMGDIAGSVYGVVATTQSSVWQWQDAAAAFVLGILISLAGVWFPARAASQLDPILALHNIETRRKEAILGWGRTAIGIVLIAASALLIYLSPARVGMTLQFIYAGLTLLGLAVLLPMLVQGGARLLRPALDQLGGSEGALAVDAMIQSPRRSSATVGALMVGIMFVFSTGAYIRSHKLMVDRWMSQMINADLFVATSAMLRSTTYHFSEELGQRIEHLPGVKRIENVRFTSVPYGGDSAALVAIEMDGFLSRAENAVEARDKQYAHQMLTTGEGILVSRNFSLRWNIGEGGQVALNTPKGELRRPVVGIVDDYRSQKGTVFLDRALYKKYWADEGVDFFDISLQPGASAASVKQDVERLASTTGNAFVYTNAEFKKWVEGLVDQFFLLNYMQLVIAVLVAMFGITNTLIISITERRREIGIIRAIGGLRSQIRKLVLLEAVAISIIGVAIGAVAAVFSTQFMTHTVSIVLAGYSVPYYFPWVFVFLSLPVVVGASLLAAWWPAQHAVREGVVEAIGCE